MSDWNWLSKPTIGPAEKIRKRALETEGYIFVCRRCGKTPEDIGWCDECGYNRDYEKRINRTNQ